MSLQIVYGNSGSGKSTYIYKKITAEAAESPRSNYFVIVPEQYTMETQKTLVKASKRGCITNIDVLSFNRLAHRILTELGMDSMHIIEDTGKNFILRKLSNDLSDSMQILGANISKHGYINQLKSLISEMTQYRIDSDILKEMMNCKAVSGAFAMKLSDLATIYEAFNSYIDDNGLTTVESILEVLSDVVVESDLLKNSVMVFDGFTGFTPVQYALLEKLLPICDRIYITITADTREPLTGNVLESDLFAMSKEFYQKLSLAAANAKVDLDECIKIEGTEGRFKDNKVLAHLEQNFLRASISSYEGDINEYLRAYVAKNPREEVRFVAREIQKGIRQGKRYRDYTVVCSSPDEYRHIIEDEWNHYGIPFFIDAKTEVIFNPFFEAVDALLQMLEGNFTLSAIMRFLRCGFTDLTISQIDEFENYCIAAGIKGKKALFNPFYKTTKSYNAADVEHAESIRLQFIEPIICFKESLNNRSFVKNYCQAIRTIVEAYNMQEKLAEIQKEYEGTAKAMEYQQIYDLVMELLDRLERILGSESMRYEEFREVLKAGCEGAKIGVLPPGNDCVIVGDIERSRIADASTLFMIGAGDNSIPKPLGSGGILSQFDRQILLDNDFVIAPSDRQKTFMQRYYLYLALTKPKDRLVITYPLTNGSDEEVNESYLFEELRKIFGNFKVEHIEYSPWDNLYTNQDAKKYLISRLQSVKELNKPLSDKEIKLVAALLANIDKDDRCRILDNIFYKRPDVNLSQNNIDGINNMMNEDQLIRTSVTRLENYSACHFAYYLSYVLGLQDREQASIDAIDRGNFYHNALCHYSLALKNRNIKWNEVTEEQKTAFLDEAIEKTTKDITSLSFVDNKIDEQQLEKLKSVLLKNIDVLHEQVRSGSFVPDEFEYDIKQEFEKEDTRLLLSGKVDRIDICKRDESVDIRIIDYKSGSKKFEAVDCYLGMQLQLPIYMSAVKKALSKEFDLPLKSSALLYYTLSEKFETIDGMDEEQMAKEQKKRHRFSGLMNQDTEMLYSNDHITEGESVVAPFKYSKDNEPKSAAGGTLVTDFGMDTVLDYAVSKAFEQTDGILSGDYSCRPIIYDNKLKGCSSFCAFKSVCQFKDGQLGCEGRRIEKIDNPIEAMGEDNGN